MLPDPDSCHVGRPVQPPQGPCRGNRRGPRALISWDLFPSLFWKDYIIYFKKRLYYLDVIVRNNQARTNSFQTYLFSLVSLLLTIDQPEQRAGDHTGHSYELRSRGPATLSANALDSSAPRCPILVALGWDRLPGLNPSTHIMF